MFFLSTLSCKSYPLALQLFKSSYFFSDLYRNHLVKTIQKRTTKQIFHQKKWNSGVAQLHMEPPPTPLISRTMSFQISNFVGIQCQKSRTSMNLIWPCLTTAIRKSSCYSFVNSTWLSRRRKCFRLVQRYNTFTILVPKKRFFSLTSCVLT